MANLFIYLFLNTYYNTTFFIFEFLLVQRLFRAHKIISPLWIRQTVTIIWVRQTSKCLHFTVFNLNFFFVNKKNWHLQFLDDYQNFVITWIIKNFVLESGLINFVLQKFWFSSVVISVSHIITQDSVFESILANFFITERSNNQNHKNDINNKICF